jgi:hypothetical protein
MLTTIVALVAASIGLVLGFFLCFFLNLLRYGTDDEPWHYDELLYEGIVALCGLVFTVIALLNIDHITALWALIWS